MQFLDRTYVGLGQCYHSQTIKCLTHFPHRTAELQPSDQLAPRHPITPYLQAKKALWFKIPYCIFTAFSYTHLQRPLNFPPASSHGWLLPPPLLNSIPNPPPSQRRAGTDGIGFVWRTTNLSSSWTQRRQSLRGMLSLRTQTWRDGGKTEPGSFRCPVPGQEGMGTSWNTGGSVCTKWNEFSLHRCQSTGTGGPKRLRSLPACRPSKATWTWSYQSAVGDLLQQWVGPGYLQTLAANPSQSVAGWRKKKREGSLKTGKLLSKMPHKQLHLR